MKENPYFFNCETTKIELEFDKTVYQNLTEVQKKTLKSAFLFSGKSKRWVSRAKEPNLYRARNVAMNLGFTHEEKEGERVSFVEKIETEQVKNENRAQRYETYAENAERRGKELLSDRENYRGDNSFLTQPIIRGHAGSERFGRARQRLYDRWDKGYAEYAKSDYFKERAQQMRNSHDPKLSEPPRTWRAIDGLTKLIAKHQKKLELIEKRLEFQGLEDAQRDALLVEGQRVIEFLDAKLEEKAFWEETLRSLGGLKFTNNDFVLGDLILFENDDEEEPEHKLVYRVNFLGRTKLSGTHLTRGIYSGELAPQAITTIFPVNHFWLESEDRDEQVIEINNILRTTENGTVTRFYTPDFKAGLEFFKRGKVYASTGNVKTRLTKNKTVQPFFEAHIDVRALILDGDEVTGKELAVMKIRCEQRENLEYVSEHQKLIKTFESRKNG